MTVLKVSPFHLKTCNFLILLTSYLLAHLAHFLIFLDISAASGHYILHEECGEQATSDYANSCLPESLDESYSLAFYCE